MRNFRERVEDRLPELEFFYLYGCSKHVDVCVNEGVLLIRTLFFLNFQTPASY